MGFFSEEEAAALLYETPKEIARMEAEHKVWLATNPTCTCCSKPAKTTILLSAAPEKDNFPRFYIPNDGCRALAAAVDEPAIAAMAHIEAVPFCMKCMRAVEDALRATILYLRAEHGLALVKPKEES